MLLRITGDNGGAGLQRACSVELTAGSDCCSGYCVKGHLEGPLIGTLVAYGGEYGDNLGYRGYIVTI